jgi:peptide/nickel transport system ATP-binding protein
MSSLLDINNLHVHFEVPAGLVRANNGVSLSLDDGEAMGIMGESGCGKTVLFLALMRLESPGKIVGGQILFGGRDLAQLDEAELRRVRGREIAIIPQNHATALNPTFTIGAQLREALRVRDYGGDLSEMLRRRPGGNSGEIGDILKELALDELPGADNLLRAYPHQLSGGIRQRVLIAMALLMRPRLLIADEPTSALDQVSRRRLLTLLEAVRRRAAMLMVSHDPDAVRRICDRVAVMYGGRVVETGRVSSVFARPCHPYTRMLLAAPHLERGRSLSPLALEPLNLIDFPPGCSFHPYCPEVMAVCREKLPAENIVNGSKVACHLYNGGVWSC